jgi:glycosyltransferase involved in cell wall biosynthesis
VRYWIHPKPCNMRGPLFTVFTATYNRAHTLRRVFDSLCAQTLRDFEWLVIDDGSVDATKELVSDWAQTVAFPVRYLQQAHSGKHIAHNFALREARGQFFVTLDSDDACVPHALERFAYHWASIPSSERALFSGVESLCCDQHGNIVGSLFPYDPLDAGLHEVRYVHRVRGEKWRALLTELVRQHPFPEISGTQFTPEGIVWLEVTKTHKVRCVNEALRIYYVDDHDTGPTLSRRQSLRENAPGRLHYYIWLLNNDLKYFFWSPMPFLKAAVMLPIVAWHSDQSVLAVWHRLESKRARAIALMAYPFAILLYLFDAARQKIRERLQLKGCRSSTNQKSR